VYRCIARKFTSESNKRKRLRPISTGCRSPVSGALYSGVGRSGISQSQPGGLLETPIFIEKLDQMLAISRAGIPGSVIEGTVQGNRFTVGQGALG
jgi:hypothetical protein